MDKDIIDQLNILVIIPLLSAAAAFAIAWFRAKTKELERKAKEDEVMPDVKILDKVIEETIKNISGLPEEKFIEGRKTRVLTDEYIEQIKFEVMQNMQSSLEESQIMILKRNIRDLDFLICRKIESCLYSVKSTEEQEEKKNNM
ncbi:MAG: hypothetical protein EWM50_06475 [Gottschalkiaceae bacterium]|nr:MAG: hypothetical protein EWM50_06475 [Gottschalkiaceae bacterium]